jgi:hypothetical protein
MNVHVALEQDSESVMSIQNGAIRPGLQTSN